MKQHGFLLSLSVLAGLLLLPASGFSASLHVDPQAAAGGDGASWATPFNTIDAAVTAASAGDELWLKQGLYTLSSEIVVNKELYIYGGFSGQEVTRGERMPGRFLTRISGGYSTRCFTFTDSGEVSGITFINGNAATSGGAIYLWDADIEISNCIFDHNSATNYGGAICSYGSTLKLINVVFTNNEAAYGGGVALELCDANTRIINSTFLHNSATTSGGGLCNLYADPIITNSIFWGNIAPQGAGTQLKNDSNSEPTVTYCDIDQDGYESGTGNISVDPGFISTAQNAQDVRLRPGSPVAGLGICGRSPLGIYSRIAPYDDFEDDDRPGWGVITGCDMGADQIHPIEVTTSDDELNFDGDCSLREALASANNDYGYDNCTSGYGKDLIAIPAGTYSLSVAGMSEDGGFTGDLDVFEDVAIIGAGQDQTIISGAGIDRVFHVQDAARADFIDLSIQDGLVDSGSSDTGGGILNDSGKLYLDSTAIENNVAGFSGGGIAISNGYAHIIKSMIAENSAIYYGGGLYTTTGGSVLVWDSAFSSNQADLGGGIFTNDSVQLFNVAVNNNIGQAIFGDSGSFVDAENVTISGNQDNVNYPGYTAITNYGYMSLTHATIANNPSSNNVIVIGSGATLNFTNSILAGNGTGTCSNWGGTINRYGHNIEDTDTCGFIVPEDMVNTDPELGPLSDIGGPTPTHAILPGSKAINAADDVYCPYTDQRGVPRAFGLHCDIGAFESTATSTLEDAVKYLMISTGTPPAAPPSMDGDVNADKRLGLHEAVYTLRDLAE